VTAIPNSHPIMPSEHEDSPTDKTRTWSVITAELDGFSHQIDETFEDRLAVLAITGPAYVRRVFGGQTAGHDLSADRLLILKHVGLAPQDNWLVGLPLPRELPEGGTA
ncbi:MAG: hypothetical protein ACHQT9_00650, partial [Candidatus Saccharimonadales bacterium]